MKAIRQSPIGCDGTDQLRTLLALHAIALGSLTQGLCMLDAEYRIALFNRRYAEVYKIPPKRVRVGMPVREILDQIAERADSCDKTREYIWKRYRSHLARRRPFVRHHRLSDGTVVVARFQPINGGGWLSVSENAASHRHGEDRLRTTMERLDEVFQNTSHGLCLFDANERLIFCNEQYLSIYGFDRNKIQAGIEYRNILSHAATLDHFSGLSAEELYERCVNALQNREMAKYQVQLSNGRVIEKIVRPLADGSWIAEHREVTVEKRHEEALHERNLLLDATLEHMAHGLCAFDRDLRVIVVNRRYLDMYGLSVDHAKPGTALIDLMRASIARGIHSPGISAEEMFVDFKRRLIERKEPVLYRQLSDGRIIAVRHQPMTNGGWVGTYEDITEQRTAEQNIVRIARHDSLTGLPNRLVFRERMAQGLARVQANAELMAVICIDLDNFKLINDSLGHPIGDKLLCSVAERLNTAIRECDTIARIGGDEFAILQFVSNRSAAEALAARLLLKTEEPVVIEGQEINAACSVGIAVAPSDGTDSDHLMQCADLALYAAKADGRNTFRCFEHEMEARVQARRALEIDMRRALTSGEFDLAYQPVVTAGGGELAGMEALVRWTHPERGPLAPAEFIRIAEETGLIVPLGEWVLRNACTEAARWPDPIKVAVNLSPIQFRNPGLVSSVVQALASAHLSARRLELEVTEAVLLQSHPSVLEILHQLRALGVGICIDDFGTGYSSLSYLRRFPFDKIKIDRSFIADADREQNVEPIIRAIAGLGAALGMATTAEGVETAEQLEIVRRAGCNEVQGYLISRPCPISQLPDLIARWRGRAAAAA
ncbi:MAG TPA: PAS-domain containing protein [Xanthobacteraceae bacterium]|jgi:diguanylate cyclase (GGDEF)-like protein